VVNDGRLSRLKSLATRFDEEMAKATVTLLVRQLVSIAYPVIAFLTSGCHELLRSPTVPRLDYHYL